jgi:putative C-S lyase
MAYDFSTVCPANTVHPFIRGYGVTDPAIVPHAVAEMRFRLAPEITCAMHDVVSVNNFGYAPPESSYAESVCSWMDRRHNWHIQPDWITQTAGVVVALGIAIRAYTQPGDGVIIQTPVYGPFRRSVEQNGRTVLENPLVYKNGKYTMDLDDLREKAKDAKLLLLCSPHNPVGRVWTRKELKELTDICLENDVLIVSDEIHFDLAFKQHTVLPTLSPAVADRCIVCTAPSKTFNLAGCALSNIIISNPDLRQQFQAVASRDCGHYVNPFGFAACEAAYTHCDGWLDQLLEEISHNSRMFVEAIHDIFPQAVVSPLEGTYLQWVDLRCLGMTQEELMDFLRSAQVFVNSGTDFGDAGEGFIRFNIACPRKQLAKSLLRLRDAADKLGEDTAE